MQIIPQELKRKMKHLSLILTLVIAIILIIALVPSIEEIYRTTKYEYPNNWGDLPVYFLILIIIVALFIITPKYSFERGR